MSKKVNHVDIVLPKAFELHGSVSDASGTTLRKVHVNIRPVEDKADGKSPPASALTETDGLFRFTNLAEGNYVVRAWARDFEAAETTVHLPTGQLLGVTLSQGAAIRGRVRGSSIERVTLRGPSGNLELSSKPDGTFHFAGLAAGRYSIGSSLSRASGTKTIDLASGQAVEVAFDPPPPSIQVETVRGTIVYSDGTPCRYADVVGFAPGHHGPDDKILVRSDTRQDGSFVLDSKQMPAVALDVSIDESTAHLKTPTLFLGQISPTLTPKQLVLLWSRPVITGRLVDEKGLPVSDVIVGDHDDFVRPDGRFIVDSGRPHSQLKFVRTGYAPLLVSVDPAHRGTLDLGTIMMTSGRSVTVTCVEADTGRPLPGVTLNALVTFFDLNSGETLTPDATVTESNGVAVLKHLPATSVSVYAERAGYERFISMEAGPKDAAIVIRLPRERKSR